MTLQKAEPAAEAFFGSLEAGWSVTSRGDLGPLVVPNGNGSTAVHRWFRMKEAFSCDLPAQVLAETGLDRADSLSVCDPFAGSGTTGVSLAELVEERRLRHAHFVGLESNPYLHLVSSVKLKALQTPPRDFRTVAQRIGTAVARQNVDPAPVPALSTFHNERYFTSSALEELLRLRAAIDREVERGSEQLAVDLARVCLGAIAESCSSLRRDGRALRFEPEKPACRPLTAFLARAQEVEDDLRPSRIAIEGTVHQVDARATNGALSDAPPFDLVLFSPPYPNNIDYTEVYKLEAWLLGFYEDQMGFGNQRWRTLRSHASLDFGDAPVDLRPEQVATVDSLIEPLLELVPESGRYAGSRRRTIRGYAYDMLQTLLAVSSQTRAGGRLVYVVGNSLHGGHDGSSVLIAADLIIGHLAQLAGFKVDEIAIARVPSRRRSSSPYLRESIVFCTKRSHG